ncbi:MAG: efflux RND transporter periplasmic adaptor subunit [Victivallaceae bacterium]|jgi:RND family efflux transporter MFP subunit|nr:efflux RND transporter periplasmic adaptor subunit [Victivallaceae bacterium]MDD3703582.1 efflux RND transporter periplasmic adaptor subunit [Victivallaceae bacterium]MDD4317286.1 efflux RND transporter periplasmic adaptor subunit [Victivallaceae bacterium]MDD5663541.1 efflux RND transporter periplasmic adaptor subunit [Victivallaceae bacterium]
MKKIKFIFFAVAVAVFIILAILYQSGAIGAGTKVLPGEKDITPNSQLEWHTLSASDIPTYYSAVGTIRSREEIDIISRLFTARVISVNFNSGDAFKSGDILVKLEDNDLQAQVEAAQENLNSAESRLKFAEEEYQRYSKLVETQIVARRVYEESVSNLNVAKAQVAMMKHELKVARTNLEYATLLAPFDGIVAERNSDPGDLATPLNPLMKVFNPAKLQLHVPIRENLYRKININDQLQVAVESSGKTFTAVVKEIVPSVDPGSRTFIINADLSGVPTGLMPGMFARCEIPVGSKSALTVPQSAILKIGQLEYLSVRADNGTVLKQLVKTVPLRNSNLLEIVSGVNHGIQYLIP